MLRCDSTGFSSAHRCDSNQDTSCSGRHLLSSNESASSHTSKGNVSCSASAAQSDVHLPGIGDNGGAGGSGAGGNSGRSDGRSDGPEGSGDDEEFLGEVEVCTHVLYRILVTQNSPFSSLFFYPVDIALCSPKLWSCKAH